MSTDQAPSIQQASKDLLVEALKTNKSDRTNGTRVYLNAHGILTMKTSSLKASEYAQGLFKKAEIDVAVGGGSEVGRLFQRAGGCCGNQIELSVRLNKAEAFKLATVLREELGDDHQPSSTQAKAALNCARPFDMARLRTVPRARFN